MKNISQINRYLLEKYPSLWNTRIIWMLASAAVVHVLFFVIGYFMHATPTSLHYTSAKSDYFSNGIFFIQLIFSVLMVVIWLIMMLKNNAFNNFYPVSRAQLFGQFSQYFIIIFACTSFYFSYKLGDEVGITQRYPDKEMAENVDLVNKTYPFLAQNIYDYSLQNRLYPQEFFDLYCETDRDKIDRSQVFYHYNDQVCQYYSVYPKTSSTLDAYGNYLVPEPEASEKRPVAYTETQSSNTKVFYFKKEVIDLSVYIATPGPSLYNFSEVFYNKDYHMDYNIYVDNSNDDRLFPSPQQKRLKAKINQEVATILNSKDIKRLEGQFSHFLEMSRKLGIRTNLDAKSWAQLALPSKDSRLTYFTMKYLPAKGEIYDEMTSQDYTDYQYQDKTMGGVAVSAAHESADVSTEAYFKQHMTTYYYYSSDLKTMLENIDSIKSEAYFKEYIGIVLWISFFLSAFVFSYRVAGLKTLLFSIVSGGIIMLGVGLFSFITGFGGAALAKYFMYYTFFFIGLGLLIISCRRTTRFFSKFVISISMVISLNTFVAWVFLILNIVNLHQEELCVKDETYASCKGILDVLGIDVVSYLVLIIGFVFIYFYSGIIRRWKALPE